jgi:AAA+ superfamily predicted ATPase
VYREELIDNALRLPVSAIPYYVSSQLATLFPEKALIACENGLFDVEEYAREELCSIEAESTIYNEFVSNWEEPDEEEYATATDGQLTKHARNAWMQVAWEGERLEYIRMEWVEGYSHHVHHWLLADQEETANAFLEVVIRWNAEVRGEILVFDDGCWHKDEKLYRVIQGATFDNLILQGTLKQDIRTDLERFFNARALYEKYHIPWKRGILLVGSPGNGKTHTVKALINLLGKPCLYVKSLKAEYRTDEKNISDVFSKARKTAPCILVLEDLDSLLTDENRSFFLNELDGFAANIGIVTLATTNHPERLDPAILDRPSRFDRKYAFNLPELPERIEYINFWNASLQDMMRLPEEASVHIATLTAGFSFAYLKELFLSSMMRWIIAPQPDIMDRIMLEQVTLLREQMVINMQNSTRADHST